MANWYHINSVSYNNVVGVGSAVGKIRGNLYYYNELLGYEESVYARIDGKTYGVIGITLYIDSNYTNKIGSTVYNDANDTAYIVGFPFLIQSENELSVYPLNKIETTTISGRYKFKNNITSYPNLNRCFVPVKFTNKDINYEGMCFSKTKLSWYSTSDGSYQEKNNVLYGTDNSTSYFTIDYPNQVSFVQVNKIRNDSKYEPLTNVNEFYTDYIGSIIDFGNTEQEVPIIFKEWIENNFEPVYPYTYTVKNEIGDIDYGSITEAPSIKKVKLTISNNKTLTLIGVNDVNYTINWNSETHEGKIFAGLAYTPNSKIVDIPIDKEIEVNLTNNTNFYEVYTVFKPIETYFEVQLYKNSAETNRVDKSNYLIDVGALLGVLRDETSVTEMSILIEANTFPTFNYVYIPIFNRYYFVTDISSVRTNLWEISLNVDVLMSYKTALLACSGFIDRNENSYNALIVDDKVPLEQGEVVETTFIQNSVYVNYNEGQYVLSGLLVSPTN